MQPPLLFYCVWDELSGWNIADLLQKHFKLILRYISCIKSSDVCSFRFSLARTTPPL